jgi:hypothetical protein
MDLHPTKACMGADTQPEFHSGEDGQVCLQCGTWVRNDVVDDPFWGFKAGCIRAEKNEP